MSRTFCALIIAVLLASCSGGPTSAPRDLDNACAILKERPEYYRAFRAAERRWGVPVHVQMATIHQESKFIADARTPFRYVIGVIPMRHGMNTLPNLAVFAPSGTRSTMPLISWAGI